MRGVCSFGKCLNRNAFWQSFHATAESPAYPRPAHSHRPPPQGGEVVTYTFRLNERGCRSYAIALPLEGGRWEGVCGARHFSAPFSSPPRPSPSKGREWHVQFIVWAVSYAQIALLHVHIWSSSCELPVQTTRPFSTHVMAICQFDQIRDVFVDHQDRQAVLLDAPEAGPDSARTSGASPSVASSRSGDAGSS